MKEEIDKVAHIYRTKQIQNDVEKLHVYENWAKV